MDRTNKPIMENGKPVVVESKFVAEKITSFWLVIFIA